MAQAAVWIPAVLIMVSGIAKLAGAASVVETLTKLGVGRFRHLLGVMELFFATLFVIPATMHLGFILSSCYFRRSNRHGAVA